MRRVLLILLLLVAVEASAQTHPIFFNRASDLTRYAAMKANYDANPAAPTSLSGQLYKYADSKARDLNNYYDTGLVGAWMYHVSGDSEYLDLAWAEYQARVLPTAACTSNQLREHGWKYVLQYDWLYPGLSPADRTTFLTDINARMSCTSFRPTDSDHTTGHYFAVAMWYLATGSYNATAVSLWQSATHKFGSFTATAADMTTQRNAIHYYTTVLGVGGMWPEATEYNMGTMKILCGGAESMRSAQSPTDNFGDVGTFCEAAAEEVIHEVSPGINTYNSRPYKWGDVNGGQDGMEGYYRLETAMLLAGLAVGKSIGPKIQDFVMDYIESGTNGLYSINPVERFLLVFDGDAPRGDHTTLDKTYYASGSAVTISRTGWTTGDTMFGARFATLYPYFIDHVTSDFGEFQVWEGSSSSWAINHARTYGGPGIDPRGTNGVSLRGVPVSVTKPVSEYHGNIVEKDDIAANGFLYFAGTQGGALSADLAYNAPPSFFQEHSRSLVWLPGVKSLVVFDRTNVKSADEGACTKYSGLFGAWINSRPRKELYIWSPENPTLTAGYTEWAYSGTKKTRVNHLTPTSFTRVVDDLNLVWVTGYYQLGSGTGVAANRKFNTRILPTVDQRWDTFLNVWNYYGDGTPVTTTLVQDAAAQVDASLVVGTGANYLLAFNAIQGPDIPDPTGSSCATNGTTYFSGLADDILGVVRLRDAGYTLSFTGPAGGTKALLFDLDPNTEWDYKINGGAAADLTVDVNGIAVVDIAATGAVTLEVISAGTLPVSVQTGSLADGKVGEAYSQTLAAIGGIGAPYTWSKTVGSFPGGLSMTAGGVISGTATTPETQTFTVQACDGDTTCGTRSLSIFVKDVPALSGGYVNGTVGVAYSDGITLTGGSAPVVYTLDSGSLCAGLSLASATGLITGTPTTTQTCQFTIKVTDNAAETDTLDASITIASARAVLTITSDPGPTSAVIHYGTVNAEDDCVVTLYDGNSDTVLDTVTSTGPGDSTRVASFSGLTPLTAYSTGIICDTADADRYTFSTLEALPVGGTVNWTYTVKPQAQLVARSVAKVSVEYNLVGETADTETASCATGCTLTLPLLSGQIYEIRHIWKTAADAVVATSRKGLVAVP